MLYRVTFKKTNPNHAYAHIIMTKLYDNNNFYIPTENSFIEIENQHKFYKVKKVITHYSIVEDDFLEYVQNISIVIEEIEDDVEL